MMKTIQAGPTLGVESETCYTVCFATAKYVIAPAVVFSGDEVLCDAVGETPSSIVWRAAYDVVGGTDGQYIAYHVAVNGQRVSCRNKRNEWSFYCPGVQEEPRFAYVS